MSLIRTATLIVTCAALMVLAEAAHAEGAKWTLDARLGISRTTRNISGLPADLTPSVTAYNTPYLSAGLWYSSSLPVDFGTGFAIVARGYESTRVEAGVTITETAREPYYSVPLLARYRIIQSRFHVLGGASMDVYTLPIENDARRRLIWTLHAGLGVRVGRTTLDLRYLRDLLDSVSLEMETGTITENYDGFLVTVGYEFFSR